MLLPQCAALLTNYLLFRRLFRDDLPAEFSGDDLPDPMSAVPHQGYFRASVTVLGLVFAGYFAAPFVHLPPYVAAFAGCLALAASGVRADRVGWGLLREVSWPVFPFVVGLFVVIGGVENLGLTGRMAMWLTALNAHPLASMAAMAGGAGLASNLVNNIPAALLARGVLQGASAHPPLVYAALLGTNIGPNLTLSGSVATLLVLTAARKKGEDLRALDFFKVGLLATPPTLLAALLALWLTFRIFP